MKYGDLPGMWCPRMPMGSEPQVLAATGSLPRTNPFEKKEKKKLGEI